MPLHLANKYKIPLIFLSIVVFSFFFAKYPKETTQETENFYAPAESRTPQIDEKIKTERAAKVSEAIRSALKNSQGDYSIYIKDLENDQAFEYKSNEIYPSASIYKLAVMYKTFDALEKGEIEKDDVLPKNQSINNNQNSYTVQRALNLMITISDNDSALLLAEKFGWANIEKFLVDAGIENFKMSPTTQASAASTAQILERIYMGEAVSKSASTEMKNLLLAQTVNDRIPKFLPKNIKVAHKTGELENIRHDAGIVYGKKSDYIFVFFSDTPKPEIAAETIATLARDIFNVLED